MTINGVSGVNAGAGAMGMNQASDPESKELQRQIADAQKKLQELSSNESMSMEEKMKKRQEIQKQISDLNIQLRQHQMELRRQATEGEKKHKEQDSGVDELTGGKKGSESVGSNWQMSGLSKSSMQAMISADGSMKQAKMQGNVAKQMEGRAGVLEVEIKLDSARGGSTEEKEKELAEVKEKAMNATSSQMNTLVRANSEVKKAEEASREEIKTKIEKADREEVDTKAKEANKEKARTKEKEEKSEASENVTEDAPAFQYTPVDVRL